MKNTLKVDIVNGIITMDRTFSKNAQNAYSPEYQKLQEVRKDYPTFRVIQKTIKRNPDKESYAGLTYDYMERYILSHGSEKEIAENLKEYSEMKLIAQCHSKGHRYPAIKSWFLETYPEVAEFGIRVDTKIAALPQNNEVSDAA